MMRRMAAAVVVALALAGCGQEATAVRTQPPAQVEPVPGDPSCAYGLDAQGQRTGIGCATPHIP